VPLSVSEGERRRRTVAKRPMREVLDEVIGRSVTHKNFPFPIFRKEEVEEIISSL